MKKNTTKTTKTEAAAAKAKATKMSQVAKKVADLVADTKPAKTTKPAKADKAKAVDTKKVKVAEAISRDEFGAREGSQAAEINAVILAGKVACDVNTLAEATGFTKSRIRNHLLHLTRNGFINWS